MSFPSSLFTTAKRRRSRGKWSLIKLASGGIELRQNGRRRLKFNFREYRRLLQLKSLNAVHNNWSLSETFSANKKNQRIEILQKNLCDTPISLIFFPISIL